MTDWRICPASGKVCFGGVHEARAAHRKAHYRIRVYACDDCGAFHVTNDEKRHQQENRSERSGTWDARNGHGRQRHRWPPRDRH